MAEEESGSISVEQARRRRRRRSYNAQELNELAQVSPGQLLEWYDARLTHIRKHWWVFPGWAMVVGFLVAGALLFYYHGTAARVACLLVTLYCATAVAYRKGIDRGFVHGFQDGHEAGVHRALGISEEQSAEIHEQATEISSLDRGRQQS